jgi:hypothetical protein
MLQQLSDPLAVHSALLPELPVKGEKKYNNYINGTAQQHLVYSIEY